MGGACCSSPVHGAKLPGGDGTPRGYRRVGDGTFELEDAHTDTQIARHAIRRRSSVQDAVPALPLNEQGKSDSAAAYLYDDDEEAPPELPSQTIAASGHKAPDYMAAVGGNWARCPACRTRHGPDDFCTAARRQSIDGKFQRNAHYGPVKLIDPDAYYPGKGSRAPRRHSTGGMRGMGGLGIHAAIDAFQTGDMTLAAEITGSLRAKDKEREEHAAEYQSATSKRAGEKKRKEDAEERAHLQFRKEQAIKGGDKRRNSLPNILAALGEDAEPRTSTKAGAVLKARYDREELSRAGNPDLPWYKLTSGSAKDEHGRRMSASLQAVHRRNSYGAIPMAAPRILNRANPIELPTETTQSSTSRLSIHS